MKQEKTEKAIQGSASKVTVSNNILHPQLYEELCFWRSKSAQEQKVPEYNILPQMLLIDITNALPQNLTQLLRIPGIEKTILDRYGEEILQIVRQSINRHGYEVVKHIVVPNPKSKRRFKMKTREESFVLYRQGKSVEEIAKERSLVVSTIEGHLLPYVENGIILVEELVAPDKIKIIKRLLLLNPKVRLSEIKAILGDGYSFGELRFVRASISEKDI